MRTSRAAPGSEMRGSDAERRVGVVRAVGAQPAGDVSAVTVGDPRGGAASGAPASGRAGEADPRSLVQSLAKGFRVLEAFSAERPELTLSEVAAAARLDPGTTFRMLNTLVMLGYVARVAGSKRFRLTMKVMDLGFHAIARTDLREVARPLLRSLVGELFEAASLGVLDGGDVLYLERVRAGVARLGVDIRVGTTIPVATSAIGHSMLAFLAPAERTRVLAVPPRPGGVPSTVMSREDIDSALAAVVRDGYALRESLYTTGLRVLAMPVLDMDRQPMAAVSIAAPAARAGVEAFLARSLGPLRAAVHDIGRAMQAVGRVMLA